MKRKSGGFVLCRGFICGSDEAILARLDASEGGLRCKGGRYGYGQLLPASGRSVIVKASPERQEELWRFQAMGGKTWNIPAQCVGNGLLPNRGGIVKINRFEQACTLGFWGSS